MCAGKFFQCMQNILVIEYFHDQKVFTNLLARGKKIDIQICDACIQIMICGRQNMWKWLVFSPLIGCLCWCWQEDIECDFEYSGLSPAPVVALIDRAAQQVWPVDALQRR